MERYRALVELLRAGGRLDAEHVGRILFEAGRTWEDLARDWLKPRGARSGDMCECGGTFRVYCTKRQGTRRVRYLQCVACHTKPRRNKTTTVLKP